MLTLLLRLVKFIILIIFSLTCNELDENSCLTCNSTLYRKLSSSNACNCIENYGEINGICVWICHYSWYLNYKNNLFYSETCS